VPVVIDASLTLGWCFEDEANPFSDSVLAHLETDTAVVPAVWPLEVANALVVGERRGRLTEAQTSRFLDLLAQLPIDVEPALPAAIFGAVISAARGHRLTSYDASYLELAERRGVPLATQDDRLREAAVTAGVSLVQTGP
jgi:predicted nucleic acid-binding protein